MSQLDSTTADTLRGFGVSRESLDRLEVYVQTLERWQARINLVGPSTLTEVWHRHILDALQLLPHLPGDTKIIAELGSGAGIPGLVLAIAGKLSVHLYESNAKKCAFLREAARLTGTQATIHNVRLETLGSASQLPRVDVVVARALAPLPQLLQYAEPFLRRGAIGLFHKGQDVESELTAATKCWKLLVERHRSVVESNSVILEVKEALHV